MSERLPRDQEIEPTSGEEARHELDDAVEGGAVPRRRKPPESVEDAEEAREELDRPVDESFEEGMGDQEEAVVDGLKHLR